MLHGNRPIHRLKKADRQQRHRGGHNSAVAPHVNRPFHLKGPDLVVIARHFARIFLQNSINLGLRTIICPEIEAETGDEIEVTDEKVFNKTSGRSFEVVPLPAARQAIIDAGGLISYTRQLLLERAQK
jgi:3-isopropylmalate dehydratase small subunit